MKYKADIDGLRAIAVIAVIIFHSGFGFLSGGYIGVDIFFVISGGYLITGLIYDEMKCGGFNYINFYKRRIARLLPALSITLLFVLVFGIVFFDNAAFDNLGKEIFFSAIGAINILFAQGLNYFAQEESVKPLLHLWSLGVEEQFYLVWPTVLLLLCYLKDRNLLLVVITLLLVSLYLSITSIEAYPIKAYFYPQYRAFELLIGALTALVISGNYFNKYQITLLQRNILIFIALLLMILPMFLLNDASAFPGINALYPCLGAAMFIAFSQGTIASHLISSPMLVGIGLISYPLYLYHQPIISYLHFFDMAHNSFLTLTIVLVIAIPLAWGTYQYVEKPIRKKAHRNNNNESLNIYFLLLGSVACFAVVGVLIAKNNGFETRFKFINPFAYAVTQHSVSTFHKHFDRGLQISKDNSKILFIGDSLLQQYVVPISKALNINLKEVDTVTRGGCVLLKNVEFLDKFSDISCNALRQALYNQTAKKYYKYVVISQNWSAYDEVILNSESHDVFEKWTKFLNDTVFYFRKISDKVIIIGTHVHIKGIERIRPTVFLNQSSYLKGIDNLEVTNHHELEQGKAYFKQWELTQGVHIIHSVDIWYKDGFILHNNHWAFFADAQHITAESTAYVVKQLRLMDNFSDFIEYK